MRTVGSPTGEPSKAVRTCSDASFRDVDVAVIGAGVIGAAIARELSRYRMRCVLLEKESDVAEGASKANNGIVHAGYAAPHGTTKARLNVLGSAMFSELASELDVPYSRVGSIVVALDEQEVGYLRYALENGRRNGVVGLEILDRDSLRRMEPNVNPEAKAGLYASTTAIVSPYELTLALAENAAANGVGIILEAEVVGISRIGDGCWDISTSRGAVRSRVVVNAAGLFSDRVASMVGDDSFVVRPRRGEYHVLDKSAGGLVRHVVFPVATALTKGIAVTPTVDGNVVVGPTADCADDKEDVSTTFDGLQRVLAGALRLVPSLPASCIIAQYAGLRATVESEDFLIGASSAGEGFINVAGIQSPGLAASPAIAREVSALILSALEARGISPALRDDFVPRRRRLPRFGDLGMDARDRLVAEDPDWGAVVCRCELVTRKEVLEAIRGPLGARTVDAVKRRTRAGMGRCQGSFCLPRVAALLSEALGISWLDVSKCGGESKLVTGRTKDVEDIRV